MASDPKSPLPPASSSASSSKMEVKGIRIFTYPKVVYMYPTFIVALFCTIGMWSINDRTDAQRRAEVKIQTEATGAAAAPLAPAHERFNTPENLMGVLFLGVFCFNLLMMGLDFPRFTIVAVVFLVGFVTFFVLWLGAYFNLDLMRSIRGVMASIYAYANWEFYGLVTLILGLNFLVIYLTRWLDYWQILPNEILHHHGPLSDLERYPTEKLKLEKEIPDVLEFMLLGSGRLVLNVVEERKAIVLDNVLFINSIERALKNLMSRVEVRITTDQEVSDL